MEMQQKVYVRGGKKEEEEEEEIEVEVYNQGMTKTELCNKWQEAHMVTTASSLTVLKNYAR